MTSEGIVTNDQTGARPGSRLTRRLRLWRSEAGQTLVEFSLVLPVMLLLLFALVDFGRGFYSWLVITNSAREGARVGATQATQAAIQQKVIDTVSGLNMSRLDPAQVTNAQGERGSMVTVDVTYHFQYVTPIGGILSFLTGGSLATPVITSHASMRLE